MFSEYGICFSIRQTDFFCREFPLLFIAFINSIEKNIKTMR